MASTSSTLYHSGITLEGTLVKLTMVLAQIPSQKRFVMFHLPDIERQRKKKEAPLTQASYSGPPRGGTPSRGSIRTGGGENQL